MIIFQEWGNRNRGHAAKYQYRAAAAQLETISKLSLYVPWPKTCEIPVTSCFIRLEWERPWHASRYPVLDSVPAPAIVAKYDVPWHTYGVEPIAEFVIAAAFQWTLKLRKTWSESASRITWSFIDNLIIDNFVTQ